MKASAAAYRALALLLGVFAADCSREGPMVAGGWTDTETGPKISGIIHREDGSAAAGALVLLRPLDYLGKVPGGPDSLGTSVTSGSVMDGFCDSAGRFAFDSVGMGLYVVESRDREIRAVTQRLAVDKPKGSFTLPTVKVGPVGTLSGRVRFGDGLGGRVLVRIFGLERATTTDVSGAYFFGNVPGGDYTLHFSGLDPFILTGDKTQIRVIAGAVTNAGEILLEHGSKQAFHIEGGGVRIDGVDSTNPIVIENGAFRTPVDGAYLWAKASVGHADLRGTIASFAKDTGETAVRANVANCAHWLALARSSGMRNLPDPVAGARRKLVRSPGGGLETIKPDSSDGALLLVREARKASSSKPLLFITGANLTTAAQAMLLAPDIADRMVVLGANNDNYNNDDSLAGEVVSRKGRFVAWTRDHVWSIQGVDWKNPEAFPANPLGDALRNQYGHDTINVLRAFGFYGDWGAAAWLYRPTVWAEARKLDYSGPALKGAASTRAAFDFIDIPASGVDWHGLNEEFFAGIKDAGAYHPWPLPGSLEAEAYRLTSNVAPDTNTDEKSDIVVFKGTGSWSEYSVELKSAATLILDFRYLAAGQAGLKITDDISGAIALVDMPGLSAWGNATAELRLDAGVHTLRFESVQGTLQLNRVTAAAK